MKCTTSGIFPVSRREQNEVDDFYKSTSRDSTNRYTEERSKLINELQKNSEQQLTSKGDVC